MFELTNEERVCFALVPVSDQWECLEAKMGPFDQFKTHLYLDGDRIVKCILSSESQYCEYELDEKVTSDRKFLLPKTTKGKPVPLTSPAIVKRRGIGMRLDYHDRNINLYNEKTECSYYFNSYLNDDVRDLEGFVQWVRYWCDDTKADDRRDIAQFSGQKRRHVRYREGDVFRFKIGRRLYGYGRVLLDYNLMRRKNEPFWDILMSKPLVCSVFHHVSEKPDISLDELTGTASLPSTIIADNALYYGEYEIVGNIPITDKEDYPILYGNSIRMGEKAVYYQCGKFFRKIENRTAICGGFRNNGVSFNLNVTLDILRQCILEKSNDPYWAQYYPHWTDRDLRNPKYAEKLKKVKQQIGI